MNICEPKHDRTILQALFQLITGKNVPLPGHHLNSSNNKLYLHLNEFIRLYIPIHSTQHSLGSQTIAKYFGIHPNMDYPPLNPPTRGYDLCERTGLPTSTSHPQHVLTSQMFILHARRHTVKFSKFSEYRAEWTIARRLRSSLIYA